MTKRNDERTGMTAFIRYRGGVKGDSSLVDDGSGDSPLPVVLGSHRVPAGIENALYEMEVGESRELDIPAQFGYSAYLEKEAQWFPRLEIPDGYQLKIGSVLPWTNPIDGSMRAVRVVDETDDYVKIDFNHPFAGKDLEYWVELVDLR